MEQQKQCTEKLDCRIIFSDIDGTLLDSSHHVQKDTGKKILELEKRGIPFILVSARMPDGVRVVQRELKTHSPIVCYSGGLILDEGNRILHSCQMNLSLASEVKELLEREYPRICCNTYGMNRWIVDDDRNPWVIREERITEGKADVGRIRQVFAQDGGIHKFLLMGEPEDILAVEQRLRNDYPELMAARSNANYLEVMDGAVHKSVGVRVLCRHYGISENEAAAFGDGENDIDMIQAVRYGFAMANAPETVRRQAAYLTGSNDEGGILDVIRRIR